MSEPPLFVFGTLLDSEVLERVLGRAIAPDALEPARLAGFRRVRVRGASYPMLVVDPGSEVEGALLRGLDAAARARLDAYEGPAYRLAPVEVVDSAGARVQALVYEAVPGALEPSEEPWDLARWQARDKVAFLARGEASVDPAPP